MVKVIFYEKPGCANNSKQKQLLKSAGVELDTRNLLTEAWTTARLKAFFTNKPVSEWFNRSAPRVKSGEINPDTLSDDEALNAMVVEPILIRRPLIQYGNFQCSGFDWNQLVETLGLTKTVDVSGDLETCPRQHTEHNSCAPPEATQ